MGIAKSISLVLSKWIKPAAGVDTREVYTPSIRPSSCPTLMRWFFSRVCSGSTE